MPSERRRSNELAASVRLDQLRKLQNQLSLMIKDAKNDPMYADDESTTDADESMRSTSSVSSWARAAPSVSRWEQEESERSSLLENEAYDVEAGLSTLPQTYKPRQTSPIIASFEASDDTLLTTHRTASLQPSVVRSTSLRPSKPPSTVSDGNFSISQTAIASSSSLLPSTSSQISDVSSSDMTATDRSTDPTVGTNETDGGALDASVTSRGSGRWSLGQRGRALRSPGRSISRSLSRRRSSSKPRSSIFKKQTEKRQRASSVLGKGDKSARLLPNYDFLSKEMEEKEGSSLRPDGKWWHGVFLFSLVSVLACAITLLAPYPIGARTPTETIATMPWSDGCRGLQSCICPRETICADDLISMIFLTVARSSAWFDYPLYMLLFMSKANNLNNFLQRTALRCWINFSDYHRVHSLFGIIVGIESTSHSFFHILRWARRRNDIQLLWRSKTGVTGFIALNLIPFIVLPMTVPYLKNRMTFEWRKGLHYLSVVWGVALVCHAPQRIFWLVGAPLLIYTADKMAEGLFKTHLVESAHFQRLGDTSCLISFENPPGFGKQNSAYVYLMLPWLSKSQFHAFTVFPDTKTNHSSICVHKCGNWTGELMKAVTTPAHKPAFVVGPFLSPFSSPAMDSENLVAVASGIGVTPAISLIKQYSSTSRRLNLVWICRDAGLVEHFLQNVDFGSDGYTLIYYTGKERSVILGDDLPPNIFIFNGRPNLERTISGIIASIATGEGLPEELHKKVLTRTPAEMRSKLLLEKALSIYTMDQLYNFTVKASNYYNEGPEPLVDMVNYQGVLSTMKHLLGDDVEDVTESIIKNFERIDAERDCRLDRGEFEFFYLLMTGSTNTQEVTEIKRGLHRMSTCRDIFESGGNAKNAGEFEGPWKDEFDIKKHLQGDGKFSAKNWNMLYCGGSQPVLDQLKQFKRKCGIGLSVEKFDW